MINDLYNLANNVWTQILFIPLFLLFFEGLLKNIAESEKLRSKWIKWLLGIDLALQGLAIAFMVICQELLSFPQQSGLQVTNRFIWFGICALLIIVLALIIVDQQKTFEAKKNLLQVERKALRAAKKLLVLDKKLLELDKKYFFRTNGIGFLAIAVSLVLWRIP